MRNALVLASLLLLGSLVAFGQGYDVMPADAKIIPIGEAGTLYENFELGVRGGTYTEPNIEDPRGWNDQIAKETSTTFFTSRMSAGLVQLDAVSGAIVPALAKSWDISEDGLTITFHLREGIKWSDGVDFTSADVLFTFNDIVLNEDVDTDSRDGLVLPDGSYPVFSAPDDYTVVVEMSVVFRPVLTALSANLMPKHKLEGFLHKLNPDVVAGTFNETWTLDTALEDLVSIGPYVIVDYQPNVSVTMERNPYYWVYDPAGTQLPYFDTHVSAIVANQNVSMLKFRNGEVDTYGVRPEDIPILLPEAAAKGFEVMITDLPLYGTTWFCLNQDVGLEAGEQNAKREVYRNVKFREALAHLIDKQTMITNVLNGLGAPQWSPISMPSPFYAGRDYYGGPVTETNAVWFEYDPAKAAGILDDLGVVDADGDGWRDLPNGEALALEINTNDNTTRTGYCLIYQDDLRAVGLNATFQVVDFNTLVGRLLGSAGDIIQLGLTGGDEPNSGRNVYGSCSGLHAYRYSACDDPTEVDLRIDELYSLGTATFDLDEAFAYYAEAQDLIARDLGYIYMVNRTFQYAHYDYIGNAQFSSPTSTPSGVSPRLEIVCFDKRL